jgi:hypothetical protein
MRTRAMIFCGLVSCSGNPAAADPVTCGTGTKLEGATCVATSSAPAVTCGPNTTLNAQANRCEAQAPAAPVCGPSTSANAKGDGCDIVAGACGANTTLDAATSTCKVAPSACGAGTTHDAPSNTCVAGAGNHGTELAAADFAFNLSDLYFKDQGVLKVVGSNVGLVTSTVQDPDPLFLKNGEPLGFSGNGKIPVHWFAGPQSMGLLAGAHPFTWSEWKKCKGGYKVFKDPPNAKKVYRFVIDVSGCPPHLLMTAAMSYSPTDKDADRWGTAPLGGLPSSFVIDEKGVGHWERDVDPKVFLQGGQPIYGATYAGTTIPDLAMYPAAHAWVIVFASNIAQTNGNAGFCERDMNTNDCVTPPSTNVYFPGQFGVDAFRVFQSNAPVQVPNAKPIPLNWLQPY